MISFGIIPGITTSLGALGVCVLAVRRMLRREKADWASPFAEKLVRPAGESLRLRMDELRERIGEKILAMLLFALVPGLMVLVLPPARSVLLPWFMGFLCLLSYLAGWRQWRMLVKIREELRRVHLGFDGERYVAEELNQLMSRGYRVFHDVVVDWLPGRAEQVFNVDHVAVGPEGVFVIETKTRRKPKDAVTGRKLAWEVQFDGRQLKFGDGPWRSDAIDQARRNGELISKWLSGSRTEPVAVRPLVVIPGWFVKQQDFRNSGVQRAKDIAQRIPGLGRGPRLTAAQIREFGDRLERHCRNVEGA